MSLGKLCTFKPLICQFNYDTYRKVFIYCVDIYRMQW